MKLHSFTAVASGHTESVERNPAPESLPHASTGSRPWLSGAVVRKSAHKHGQIFGLAALSALFGNFLQYRLQTRSYLRRKRFHFLDGLLVYYPGRRNAVLRLKFIYRFLGITPIVTGCSRIIERALGFEKGLNCLHFVSGNLRYHAFDLTRANPGVITRLRARINRR